jgi:peptide-methionine (R)-S-oxide reductase
MSNFPVQKSEDEWRAILSPAQFKVLREKGTERPGTGEYENNMDEGVYTCGGMRTLPGGVESSLD